MVIRQQVSDVISYGHITTTITKAKETQRHLDKVITLAKKGTLDADRRILAVLLNTKNDDMDALLKKAHTYANTYKTRKGGYSRVLKLGSRPGDRTEEAILQLV
jgi:large subunit ribosomal protein L17